MKLFKKTLFATLCVAMATLSFGQANWKVYLPGAKDANDAKKDLEAQGFVTFDSFSDHFSFLDKDGGKVLLLNTLDGKNDAVMLPLTGKEKKVTVLFKAKGDVNPDNTATPYGVLWACVQNGAYQAVLRHNSSNQLKGSSGQTSLKPENIVSDWHDYRLVYDIQADGKTMTATAFINGTQRHQTKDFIKEKNDVPDTVTKTDDGSIAGKGNYLLFGENDNSTSGYARYAYIVVITDEDVSSKSLDVLSKTAGFDMAANPVIKNDKTPPSHRPSKKPLGLNMTPADLGFKEGEYLDPSTIKDNVIDATKLPFSKEPTEVITPTPALPKIKFTATVDQKLKKSNAKKGKFRSIQEAMDAVSPNAIVKIMPGAYYEKIKITKPVKLVGTNPLNTIIYGYEADTGGIDGNLLVEVNLLPQGVTSEPGATQSQSVEPKDATFSACNITFYNKGAQWNKSWGYVERRSIALCMKGVQQAYIENCIFLGQQDTLYFRSGRAYLKNCYIEGEVDFICGGQTVFFDACKIFSLNYINGGYITAAAPADTANDKTKEFANGYVFNKCKILGAKAFANAKKKVFLGRGAWNGGSATAGKAQAKVVYNECELGGHIDPKGWADWDNVNTADKSFFREYKCTGAGAIQVETETRKFLTDDEAKKFSNAKDVLGFEPAF